jgi:multidrug resistance efflux pump
MSLRCLVRARPWSLGIAALVIGAGWALHRLPAGGPPAEQSVSEPPAATPAVVCFGHVDLEHGVTPLFTAEPGRVIEVQVAEGDEVSAGAVLIRLDDRAALARLREAEASVEAARVRLAQAREQVQQHQAQVARLQAGIDALGHRLEAAQRLHMQKQDQLARDLENKLDTDIAAAQVKEVKALREAEQARLAELRAHDPSLEVRQAAAELAGREAARDGAQRQRDDCLVKAPCAGTVLRLLTGPGETLAGPAGRPAVQFCPRGPRLVRAEVDQENAPRVAVGQAVGVEDDRGAGPRRRGRVIRVSDWFTQRRSVLREPLQVNDVRTLECLIALEPGESLRIGQRVRVLIGGGASD